MTAEHSTIKSGHCVWMTTYERTVSSSSAPLQQPQLSVFLHYNHLLNWKLVHTLWSIKNQCVSIYCSFYKCWPIAIILGT